MRATEERNCERCGTPFTTRRDTKTRFCSTECVAAHSSEINRGRRLSRETRQRMSEAVRRRWQDPEQRAKFTDRAYPPMPEDLKPVLAELRRLTWNDPEHRAKRSEAMRRRWASEPGMADRLAEARRRPEVREKMRQGRLRRTDFPRTDIEILLGDAMRSLGLTFEEQKPMFGRFIPDFVFEDGKLLVQADGEYWHRFERNRRYDAMLREAIAGTDWHLLRFDAAQIHADAFGCARIVQNALHG